ncbi:uncharacterized protein G2W53_019546 [Senna tora]|uniref:Uncharacterized protein n=1 Tax=Senna tora TaxID=362788 RepID=A0A834WMF3_9FABA|nr:uncharacterized protein G2W53_019546 [Senna tora]
MPVEEDDGGGARKRIDRHRTCSVKQVQNHRHRCRCRRCRSEIFFTMELDLSWGSVWLEFFFTGFRVGKKRVVHIDDEPRRKQGDESCRRKRREGQKSGG